MIPNLKVGDWLRYTPAGLNKEAVYVLAWLLDPRKERAGRLGVLGLVNVETGAPFSESILMERSSIVDIQREGLPEADQVALHIVGREHRFEKVDKEAL